MAILISKIRGMDNVTYDLQDKVSIFGGTNLLEDRLLQKYASATGTLTKTDYHLNGSLTYTRSATTNQGFYIDNYTKLIPNTQYIISFKAACTSGSITQFYVFRGTNHASISLWKDGVQIASAGANADVTASVTMSANTYYDFMIKYTTPATIANNGSYTGHILQWNKQSSVAFTVSMQDLKWEMGNKPTAWTPAPQDLVTYDGTDTLEFFQ